MSPYALVFMLIFLPLLFDTASAQWTRTSIEPDRVSMTALVMRDSTTGLCVGERGILRRLVGKKSNSTGYQLVWSSESVTARVDLNDVSLLKDSGFVLVGNTGTILVARSNTAPFEKVTSLDTLDLNAVCARGSEIMAVGDNGSILRSTDNGEHWERIESGIAEDLIDCCANDQFWSVASRRAVYISDNGMNFISKSNPTTVNIRRVSTQRRPLTLEWMLYRLRDNFTYEVSTDAGTTWYNVLSSVDQYRNQYPNARALSMATHEGALLHSVMFYDDASNTPFHFASFDGGFTWIEICQAFALPVVGNDHCFVGSQYMAGVAGIGTLTFNRVGLGSFEHWYAPEGFRSSYLPIAVTTRSNGFVVAGDRGGVEIITASRDLGSARVVMATEEAAFSRDIDGWGDTILILSDTVHSYYIGATLTEKRIGRIYRTTNGGEQWNTVFENSIDSLGVASIAVDRSGMAVAYPYGSSVIICNSFGSECSVRRFSDTSLFSRGFGAIVTKDEVLVSTTTSLLEEDVVYASSDGGSSWSRRSVLPFQSTSWCSTPTGRIIVAGRKISDVGPPSLWIAFSDDKGYTWHEAMDIPAPQQSTFIRNIQASGDRVVATSQDRLFISDDFGTTYRAENPGPLEPDEHLQDSRWVDRDSLIVITSNSNFLLGRIDRSMRVQEHSSHVRYTLTNDNVLQVQGRINAIDVFDTIGRQFSLPVVANDNVSTIDVNSLKSGVYCFLIRSGASTQRIMILR